MKLNSSLIGFIIALLICVGSLMFYFWYIAKDAVYVIDNPTENSLEVTVDNENYTLAPNQTIEIALNKGEHHLKSEKVNSDFEVEKVRGTLNPTQALYVIFSLPYGSEQNTDSIFRSQKTTIDGKIYYGKIKLDSSDFIQDYYYGLKEKFPGVTLRSEYDSTKIRSKLFRKDEFKQYYFEKFE